MTTKNFLCALLFLTGAAASAQNEENPQERAVFFEMEANADFFETINFDSRFKSGSPWGYRVGIGYAKLDDDGENDWEHGWESQLHGVTVPLEVNYLFGKGKKNKFELGVGFNVGRYSEKRSDWFYETAKDEQGYSYSYRIKEQEQKRHFLGYSLYCVVGYRYQPKHGFMFRAGLNPTFNLHSKNAVPRDNQDGYLSIGYAF